MSGYDTIDGSLAYDFGHFRVKLQGFNLLDRRAITSYTGGTKLFSAADPGIYTFQAGRQLEVTLEAKF
jgi:outer membrane receptor protein involved in Fe transport